MYLFNQLVSHFSDGKSRTAGHAGTIVVFAFVLTLVLGLLMRGTLRKLKVQTPTKYFS